MSSYERSIGQGSVLERRQISLMLRHIDEYELVKSKKHSKFKTAVAFYKARDICKQNFLKYYRRFLNSDRNIDSLLPRKSGRKFKDALTYTPELIEKIKDIRGRGYNRYDISFLLNKYDNIEIAPTTLYRLLKKLGLNKLNPVIKEEKRRIIKMSAGELGHIDIHYLSKGIVKSLGNKQLYLLGIIDSYSRICWVEVVETIKAQTVMFSAMDALMILKSRYNIEFKEILSDNGQEFSSPKNPEHPFEKMLSFLGIKHRYTRPFTPKTNGKIERFWKTIEDELLFGEEFETLDELKHYIKGYNLYYNEHRIHQGINLKIPVNMI